MSRKDFMVIADALANLPGWLDSDERQAIVNHFTHCLNASYGNFDSGRFASYIQEHSDGCCLRSGCQNA